MKIAAYAKLRELHLIAAKYFAGTADGVVLRVIEIVDIVGIHANFGSEEFCIEGHIFNAGIAVQPAPVGESKWLSLGGLGFGSWGLNGFRSCRNRLARERCTVDTPLLWVPNGC